MKLNATQKQPTNDMKIKLPTITKLSIDDQRLKDILCSAFEGGSNYWIEKVNILRRPECAEYWHESPVTDGVLEVIVSEDEPIEGKGKKFLLDRAKLQSGLDAMAKLYPRHFADFISENDDATTGDVFLQCCLFGEAIFG
jgi:hypothetical protein